jgi:hypothetical protein
VLFIDTKSAVPASASSTASGDEAIDARYLDGSTLQLSAPVIDRTFALCV